MRAASFRDEVSESPKCLLHAAVEEARSRGDPNKLANKGLLNLETEECKTCDVCRAALKAISDFAINGRPEVFEKIVW
jgi:hypothetical protein